MKQPALLIVAYLLFIAVMLDTSMAAPPSVGAVSSEDSINPVSGTTRTVTCNATLTDEDGYENITLAEGRLFDGDSADAESDDDNNNHYTDSSCTLTGGTGNTVYAECSFDLWYYANAGSNWECNITATDGETIDSSSTGGSISVQELKAMTATSLEFDDGSGGPINLGDTSSQETMTINNTGNTDINVKVNGGFTAMTCDSGSIPLGNERYNITDGFSYGQGIQLTDSPTTIEGLTVTQREDDSTPSLGSIYWLLRMPINGVGGDCVGLITLNAE